MRVCQRSSCMENEASSQSEVGRNHSSSLEDSANMMVGAGSRAFCSHLGEPVEQRVEAVLLLGAAEAAL